MSEKHGHLGWGKVAAFIVCFGSLFICTVKHYPTNICLKLNRKYSYVHFRIHPNTSSNLFSLVAKHAHVHSVWWTIWYALTHEPFLSICCFSLIILVQGNLVFIHKKKSCSRTGRFFRWFLVKYNLAFLFLSVTNVLHLEVNPLY